MNGLRLAIGTLTIFPTAAPRVVDRRVARTAMLLAPAIGLLLGSIGAALLWAVRLTGAAYGDLLGAVLVVALLAYLTRALHLDGLADTADALGSGRRGAEALAIARSGDIGPFGVVTVVLVLLIEIAALGANASAHHGTVALVLAVATGRLAATWSCVRGVPAASAGGLGAMVAGTVPRIAAAAWTVVLLVLAVALAAIDDDATTRFVVMAPVAVMVGLACAGIIVRRFVRRTGGISGDALGAAVEVATAGVLVVLALSGTVGA